MRQIKDGIAYDTETAELIKKIQHDEFGENFSALYRTRHGAFFLWHHWVVPHDPSPDDSEGLGWHIDSDAVPLTDGEAEKWLETHANELVEQDFGEMPEHGTGSQTILRRKCRK